MVAAGVADVFEIVVLAAGADAFLGCGGAVVVALLDAEEDVFELIHPGVGEEQSGVIRGDQRRAGHDSVAVAFEIAQEFFSDFVACQIGILKDTKGAGVAWRA